MSEQIVTGKKYRILTDVAQKIWQRVSFWTKSSDVEFDDGKTAETKVGAISGITDSLVSTSSNIAASAKAVSELNGKLGGLVFSQDEEGNWGYKPSGADTVVPFKSIPSILVGKQSGTCNANAWGSIIKEIIPTSNTIMVVCSDYQSSQHEFSVTNGTYEPVLLDSDSMQIRISIYRLTVTKGVSVTITYDFYRPTYGGYATMFILE